MRFGRLAWIAAVWGLCSSPAPAATIEEAARAFGSMPALWNVAISPSGRQLSYVTMDEEDAPMVVVLDVPARTVEPLMSSEPGKVDVEGCGWATELRLVCSFEGIDERAWVRFAFKQLLAIDADGTDLRDLGHKENALRERIVDWLVDDPKRVMLPRWTRSGQALISMDIHTTRHDWVKRGRGRYTDWSTDGRGNLRLRTRHEGWGWVREVLPVGSNRWQKLYEQKAKDFRRDTYTVGFGADPNHLLVAKRVDGRYQIRQIDLGNDLKETVVYRHDEVDVEEIVQLGKYRRAVGVAFETGVPRVVYFDDRVREIVRRTEATLPGRIIDVLEESWNQRFYVIRAHSDRDPGTIYRLDTRGDKLVKISDQYPSLAGWDLARVKGFQYVARDGVTVPAYVTLPPGTGGAKRLPAVVLPHTGPEMRDEWGFDWLAQYLANRGYLVLQANFRGSSGYGLEWAGKGGYEAWRLALSDIEDGIAELVELGWADPNRICAVGWGYGGYASVLGTIEYPSRYECAVSIGAPSDLDQLVDDARDFPNRRSRRTQVGRDADERKAGSPLQRVYEIPVPLLLFHGRDDVNHYVEHSERLAAALEKAQQPVELVVYEDTDHSLDRSAARIDMLTRIGRFLEDRIGTGPTGR